MAPSARRTRREPSQASEQISEGNDPSQSRRNEDVDDDDSEDQQPRRAAAKVKREKKSTRKKPDIIDEDEPTPAAGPLQEEFDKKKHIDQPLNQEEGKKIHGFGADWELSRKGFSPDGVDMVKSLGGNMAEYAQNQEGGGVRSSLHSHRLGLIRIL